MAGKKVGQFTYLHVSALGPELAKVIAEAAEVAGNPTFNVIKVRLLPWLRMNQGNQVQALPDPTCITLLDYPDFMDAAFPALRESYKVNLKTGTVKELRHRNNQPILHRKELMLSPDHPRQAEFQALTKQAEQAGLFADTNIIGRVEAWISLMQEKKLKVVGHRLVSAE